MKRRTGDVKNLYRMPKEVSEMIDAGTMKALHKAQQNEITEYHIYLRLSSYMKKKNEHNSKVLQQIARDELFPLPHNA